MFSTERKFYKRTLGSREEISLKHPRSQNYTMASERELKNIIMKQENEKCNLSWLTNGSFVEETTESIKQRVIWIFPLIYKKSFKLQMM